MAKSRTAPRRPASSKPVSIPCVTVPSNRLDTIEDKLEVHNLRFNSVANGLVGLEERMSMANAGLRLDSLRREDIFIGLTFWQRVMFLLRGRL